MIGAVRIAVALATSIDEHLMIFCAAAVHLSAEEIEDEWVTCKSPWGGYCDYSVCTHCYNRVGGQA